jgi:hypothetical protein
MASSSSSLSKRSPPREIQPAVSHSPKPSSPLVGTFSKKQNVPLVASVPKKVVPRVSDIRKSLPPKPLTSRPEPMNTNTRRSGFMPREPRVMTDDTRDFADFVRSTRPTTETPLLPLLATNGAALIDKPATDFAVKPPSIADSTSQPIRSPSRSNMVPREPDVKGGGSSELINFIRQGPQMTPTNGDHRIQKPIAPLRSTLDSDDFAGLGPFGDLISTGSAHNSMTSTSRAPTINLSSGLSSSQNGAAPQRPTPPSLSAPPPQIVRKTRRVKDPYAIDSDDEDDLLTALPASGRHRRPQEESLEEFLRSTEPPKNNAPALVKSTMNGSGSAHSQSNGPANGLTNGRSINGAQMNGARPRSRSNTITSQNSVAPPKMAPPIRGPGASMNSSTPKPSIMSKKFEARAAGATRNGFGGNGFHYSMNDMADFLRSSGPPESSAPSPDVPLSKKPSKRGRRFWQRA